MLQSAAAAISLSKVMARKKGGEVSLQLEIETEAQWKVLLRKDGLVGEMKQTNNYHSPSHC